MPNRTQKVSIIGHREENPFLSYHFSDTSVDKEGVVFVNETIRLTTVQKMLRGIYVGMNDHKQRYQQQDGPTAHGVKMSNWEPLTL